MNINSTFLPKNLKFIILILLTSISSCEDFLEEVPPTFISTSNFYTTQSDARTACDGVYEMLHDGGWNSTYGRWWPAIDLGTDDVVSKVSRTNFNDWFSHTINPSHPWFESWGQYSNFWIGISRANSVIENVSQMPNSVFETIEAKNSIIGEARALRALYYFHLVRTYGDVPLIDKPITSKDNFAKPRVDVNVIFDEIIIPDLQFAETNCSEGLSDGHITKWNSKVILADVYLTRAGTRRTSQGEFVQGNADNWLLAKNKAAEIISDSPHQLIENPVINGANIIPACGVAWSEGHPFSVESMLELSSVNVQLHGSILSRECGPFPHGVNYWGAGSNKPFLNIGYNFNVIQMRFPGNPPAVGLYIPTPDLYASYEEGDERRDWNLMTKYITNDGSIYLSQPTFRKYVDIGYYLGNENTSFSNTNNNFILYRYADALLIYAEAANEVAAATFGDSAYDAVNEIRNRAGLQDLPSGLSQDQFREAVWNERRHEFAGECKRRFDLIRTNRLATETLNIKKTWTSAEGSVNNYQNVNTLFTGNVPWPDHEWLMPIPQSEIDLNAENGWTQNNGY